MKKIIVQQAQKREIKIPQAVAWKFDNGMKIITPWALSQAALLPC